MQENIAPFCPRNGTLWFGSVLLAHFMHGCKRKKGKKRRTIQDNARDNDVHTDTIPVMKLQTAFANYAYGMPV